MDTDAKGFGNGCVNFTWKWAKCDSGTESQDVVFEVTMKAQVSYLKADGKCIHKPYEYTFKDVKSLTQRFTIPPARS